MSKHANLFDRGKLESRICTVYAIRTAFHDTASLTVYTCTLISDRRNCLQ